MVRLYHYTNQAGCDAIKNSGMIRASKEGGRDAKFGVGVYFTTLDPAQGKKAIAKNNWDGRVFPRLVKAGRVDFVVVVDIPEDEVECVEEDSRDVWLYPGDVTLDHYSHSFQRV